MTEFHSTFAAQLRGLFKLESTSVVIMEEANDVETAMATLRSSRMPAGPERFVPRHDEGASTTIDSLLPVLTFLHEQDHFKVLCSTPVGLLLWRIEQCLSVDVSYLRRRLPDAVPDGFPTFLDAWTEAAKSLPNSAPYIPTVKETAMGAQVLRMFLGMVMGRSEVTVGEFLRIANVAFEYLALRSGLEPGDHARWESLMDPGAPILPHGAFSLLEILEASARARELTNLENARLSQSMVDQWYGRTIFGVYKPAFDSLMSELGSPSWIKTAVDLALGTAMDISAGKQGDVIRVEDALPSYRLPRIATALKGRTWNLNLGDPESLRELYEDLPRSLGMQSLSDLYRKMAKADFSLKANWGGRIEIDWGKSPVEAKLKKDAASLFNAYVGSEEFLTFVEKQYRRNFKLRVDDPAHFITTQPGGLHTPLLTFFRDRLSVPADQLGENPSLAFAAFQQFCTRERGRAYLYDDGANDLTRYETLFRNWNLAMGVPADFIEAVLHAQFIFESEGPGSFDGKEFFDAFRGFASGG